MPAVADSTLIFEAADCHTDSFNPLECGCRVSQTFRLGRHLPSSPRLHHPTPSSPTNASRWSTSKHRSVSPPRSSDAVSARSGSTPPSRTTLATPTRVPTSASSSVTVRSSASPSLVAPDPAPVPPPPPSVPAVVPDRVTARVPPRPVCPPRSCGCDVSVSSADSSASTVSLARSTSTSTTSSTSSPRVTFSRTSVSSWSTSTRPRPRLPDPSTSPIRWRLVVCATRPCASVVLSVSSRSVPPSLLSRRRPRRRSKLVSAHNLSFCVVT